MRYVVSINTERRTQARGFVAGATAIQQADSVREGVYVTLTALSVSLVLGSHPETSPTEASSVLLVAAGGAVIAALTADVVSHLVVHDHFPSRSELRHTVRASLGALTTVAVPLLLLGASSLGVWSISAALRASAVALLITLVVIAALAVRRITVPWWQRVLLLLTIGAAGLLVVVLQTAAHG